VAFIATRGAGNAALVKGLIPQNAEVVCWPQNDAPGKKWLKDLAAHAEKKVAKAVIPAPYKDMNEWTATVGTRTEDIFAALFRNELVEPPAAKPESKSEREPRIRFFAPSELRDFQPDDDLVLVGDCHITRGEVFVIGGEPSVGKSRSSTYLAVSGATGRDWFGLSVHQQFKTMIIQTENSRYRLRQEFSELDCDEIEKWIRVSEPPPFGLTLSNPEFQEDIGLALDSFKPKCVILDPWNAAARDDKQRDYIETFQALRNLLPTGADKPALGIAAHTRKPQLKEKRTGGTGLMHLLAGSYVLTSVPRCIFIMTRGSEDETDNSVVWFNPKNSNGQSAPRSAWYRLANGFTPATDFDWSDFDKPPDERKIVTLEHMREVFGGGTKRLYLKDAAHALATIADVKDTSAYRALKTDGKFAEYLSREGGKLKFSSPKLLSTFGRREKQ
jgi:AAA domain